MMVNCIYDECIHFLLHFMFFLQNVFKMQFKFYVLLWFHLYIFFILLELNLKFIDIFTSFKYFIYIFATQSISRIFLIIFKNLRIFS
jgi:hypothetical protein